MATARTVAAGARADVAARAYPLSNRKIPEILCRAHGDEVLIVQTRVGAITRGRVLAARLWARAEALAGVHFLSSGPGARLKLLSVEA